MDVAAVVTTVLLIRHAQPEGHEGRYPQRLSGWHDVELSPTGRTEALRLARRLRFENLTAIYSSPLRRATQTASVITEWTGLPVTLLSQLKEINCGEVEGQFPDHVKQAYPAHWKANLRQEDPDFRWPDGESYREFRARCLAGIVHIAARHSTQRIAVVTHAGVISQLIGQIRGLSPACWESFRPGTASVTVLEWRDSSGTLLSFDDRAHLQPGYVHAAMQTEHPPE